MKSNELREKYLAFFETKGCVRRPSDVLVPRWDPSVLFTPAGMNQFKDHFLGRCKLEFTRATTCQKCLRTGDIDNVGRTAYHHTFFEMLGNFSFGDYFKREAINWAWEFLTDKKWLGLDPNHLSATVYLDDDEAAGIWLNEIKLPPERLQRLGEDENFWPANAPSQGPDGVCGPCSEIYCNTEFGSVEIWNLVFTQFNRVGDPPHNLRPLPSRNIDTGMGLERTAAVLQGVDSNFHIDILRPLVEAAGEVCHVKYQPEGENGRRLRRIADHIRACTFAIHENVIPGPNKEKYVIKRLLRRAVLDGHQMGMQKPFLHKLVPTVAELMREPYPELTETVGKVSNVIEKEEAHFLSTIDAGLDRIERIFEEMHKQHRGKVSGAEAADMFQTHGFPPELFETLAAERNFTFDWPGFQAEMEKHGEISGPAEKIQVFKHDPLEALKKAMHGSTFLGYETTEVAGAKVLGIISNEQLCDRMAEVDHERPIMLVLDKTPFYGEMGGQVGDSGEITGKHFNFEVIDTKIEGAFILHVGHLREGAVELGAIVTAKVDAAQARHPPRTFGNSPPALRPAQASGRARHAAGLKSGQRPSALRFCQSFGGQPGRVAADRIRGERQGHGLFAHPLGKHAHCRGPKDRGHDALRRKVSRRGARGVGRRNQQGTLRRHAPGKYRPDRLHEDHRRRKRGGGHAANHRTYGARGIGFDSTHASHPCPSSGNIESLCRKPARTPGIHRQGTAGIEKEGRRPKDRRGRSGAATGASGGNSRGKGNCGRSAGRSQ